MNESTAQSLASLLAAELAALQSVLDCLHRESDALERRDAEALLACSQQKSDAITEVAKLTGLRGRQLDEQPAAGTPECRKLLGAVQTLATQCRQLNEANGLLIRGQRRRVEGTLNLLRGGQAAPDSYGRDGATQLRHRSPVTLASC